MRRLAPFPLAPVLLPLLLLHCLLRRLVPAQLAPVLLPLLPAPHLPRRAVVRVAALLVVAQAVLVVVAVTRGWPPAGLLAGP